MGLLQSDSSKDPKLTSVKLHLKIMRKKKKNCRKSQILSFEKAIPTTNVKKIYQPPFMCSTDKRRLEIWIGKKQ